MHESLGGQSEFRDVDERSDEHSVAMRSGAIKHHMPHEIWFGVTTNREGFGMKMTTTPCPSTSPTLLQPFLSPAALPAPSTPNTQPQHPSPIPVPSAPIPEGWMSLPEQSGGAAESQQPERARQSIGHGTLRIRGFVGPSTRED